MVLQRLGTRLPQVRIGTGPMSVADLPTCTYSGCISPGTIRYTTILGVWCLRHDPGKNDKIKHRRYPEGQNGKRPFAKLTGQAQCVYCGKDLTPSTFSQDHVIPLVRGGENKPFNKAPSCIKCNQAKGPLTAAEYLAVRHDPQLLKAKLKEIQQELRDRGYINQ